MNKIKIPYSEWAEFHTRRGNGDFAGMRYGQSFYNYFNLADKYEHPDPEMDILFYVYNDQAYAIIEKRIEITNNDEEEK